MSVLGALKTLIFSGAAGKKILMYFCTIKINYKKKLSDVLRSSTQFSVFTQFYVVLRNATVTAYFAVICTVTRFLRYELTLPRYEVRSEI